MHESGLSEVEKRSSVEVAAGTGARKTVVWVGKALNNKEGFEKAHNKSLTINRGRINLPRFLLELSARI